MARMSIDDKVCRDPRITVLANLLGWTRRETLGCLIADVWAICYDQTTHLVSARIIDAAAGHEGFANAMVECELATVDRSGKLAIVGAKKRIKYLDHKSSAGREGGLKSAESRRKVPKQTSSNGGSTPQATGNPNPNASVNASASVSVPDPAPDKPTAKSEKSASQKAQREPSGPTQQAIHEFEGYFQRTHAGARPTWKGRNAVLMHALVEAHGVHEITRRLAVLEKTPPSFPSAPWDMPTFSQHFDKIASSASRQQLNLNQRDLRAGDLLELQLQRVAEAEQAERERNSHD